MIVEGDTLDEVIEEVSYDIADLFEIKGKLKMQLTLLLSIWEKMRN